MYILCKKRYALHCHAKAAKHWPKPAQFYPPTDISKYVNHVTT